MFRTNQIINKTQLLKHFNNIVQHLDRYPQPILITQKRGGHFVLVNAEIFEEFLESKLHGDGIPPTDSHFRDSILHSKS